MVVILPCLGESGTSSRPRSVQLRRIFRILHHMLEPVDRYSTIVQLAERHSSLIIVVIVTMMNM
jgi:hypothetical protein